MARTRNADSEQTWRALVDAATQALAREGPAHWSLRGVAKSAGLGLGTLQYYFPSRDDLIEAVLGDVYRRIVLLVERQACRLRGGASLEEVTPELVREFYRGARRHRNLCRARMASNLLAGRMSSCSREALLDAAGGLIGQEQVAERDLTLALHTLSVLMVRYGAHSPEELARLLDTDPEDATARVEAHLVRVARHLAADLG